jgi:hypothetical protein
MSNSSFSRFAFHIGDEWRMDCSTYGDTTPILSLDAAGCGLTITTRGNVATVEAVQFARELARETRRFAEDLERMHAAQLDDDTKAVGSDAA